MAKTKKVRKFGRSSRSSTELDDIDNPTVDEINIPSDQFWDYIICVFGEKGIGKSSLVSAAPGAMNYMWEPGRANLKIRQYPYKKNGKMLPPLTFALQKQLVEKGLKDDSITVMVFDTIDRLYKACLNEWCFDRGIKDPSEMEDFGQTWRDIQEELEQLVLSIKAAGKGVCFTSHSSEKIITTSTGNRYSKVVPSCMKGAYESMKALCDYAFYYGYVGNNRALTLRGDELIWSACGVSDHFMDVKTGKELKQILIPDSVPRAYSRLLRAFNNQVEGVSPEQAKELVETAVKPKKKRKSK